jgi:hypothetical protein
VVLDNRFEPVPFKRTGFKKLKQTRFVLRAAGLKSNGGTMFGGKENELKN